MPRPRKMRRVCCLPESDKFGPADSPQSLENTVIMTVDEYETIRLIDFEGLLQEECAVQMNIARTTVQSIYSEARKKMADALVNRKWLFIRGGDFVLCERGTGFCRRHGCGQGKCRFVDDH
ncbi:MAG: DUF134 domain-containing protein [Candidatus Izemoplasmatales bacterium]